MIVWVKLVDFRVTVSVCAVPKVPFDAERVLFRGIVVSVLDAEAETTPLLTLVSKEAEQDSFFVPSLPWVTLTVFVMMVCEPLVDLPVLNVIPEKEYFVPSIVIEPVHSPVALYDP